MAKYKFNDYFILDATNINSAIKKFIKIESSSLTRIFKIERLTNTQSTFGGVY